MTTYDSSSLSSACLMLTSAADDMPDVHHPMPPTSFSSLQVRATTPSRCDAAVRRNQLSAGILLTTLSLPIERPFRGSVARNFRLWRVAAVEKCHSGNSSQRPLVLPRILAHFALRLWERFTNMEALQMAAVEKSRPYKRPL